MAGFAFLCCTAVLFCIDLRAQAPVTPSAPPNARNLLLQAAKENSLHDPEIKPWRLKISYTLPNEPGHPVDHGVIEETWAGPELNKLVITAPGEQVTYTRNGKGVYRAGDLDRKLALLLLVEKAFVSPIPIVEKSLWHLDLNLQTRTIGSSQLRCLTLQDHGDIPSTFNDPTYCFTEKEPILRLANLPNDPHQFLRNNVGKFQDRFIPIDVVGGQGPQPDVTAHLDLLQRLVSVNPDDFVPPPNAKHLEPAHITIYLLEGDFDRHVRLLNHPKPEYPPIAQAAQVHGTVVLRVAIGTDGHVESANVIKGPEMLRQAALDYVWQLRVESPMSNEGPAQIRAIVDVKF